MPATGHIPKDGCRLRPSPRDVCDLASPSSDQRPTAPRSARRSDQRDECTLTLGPPPPICRRPRDKTTERGTEAEVAKKTSPGPKSSSLWMREQT